MRGVVRAAPLVLSVVALLLGTLALLALVVPVSGSAMAGPRVGARAPDFRLAALDGGTVESQTLRGRPVVLYFFATWCPSCRFDLPMLDAVQGEHAGGGLVVLLVTLQSSQEHVRAFVDGWGFRGPVALDGDGALARGYRVQALPTTFFVGRDGTLRAVHRGPLMNEALEAALAGILAVAPS